MHNHKGERYWSMDGGDVPHVFLGREDIFSYGDVGLQNAIKKLYGIKDPTPKELEPIVSLWSPYRTYACLVLWKSL